MNGQASSNKTASSKITLATRILTILMAAIWVFFGFGFIVRTNQVLDTLHHLEYPLYLTYVLGTTHILGGLGLLIPNRPRLTQWVFAGLTYDLLLAAYSHIASHDTVANALHPVVLIVVLMVLMGLRTRTGDNLWSSR